LPIAIHAPHALLVAHRIPRQIVIHQNVAELQVDPFAARLRGDQKAHLRVVRKSCWLRSLLSASGVLPSSFISPLISTTVPLPYHSSSCARKNSCVRRYSVKNSTLVPGFS